MRILALEPYHGGSHRAFLSGWSTASRHRFQVLGLPPFKWKWRMRHGAITLAEELRARTAAGESWDLLFCSDMLNLAELLGLAPPEVRSLPAVVYFHENQITYPVQVETERDVHFGLTNLTTALAADEVWFNSAFHRDSLLEALPAFLGRMPDYRPLEAVERVREKARVRPPGIARPPSRGERRPGPMRILWAARWEHDKDPETFFEALEELAALGVDFRLSVVGERFRRVPPIFARARARFARRLDRWGYQKDRREYEASLAEADLLVSTARHEFFGLAVVEAVAAGCYPVVPRRLSYPEILDPLAALEGEEIFYQGDARALAGRLRELAQRLAAGRLWRTSPGAGARALAHLQWEQRAPRLDAELERAAARCRRLVPAAADRRRAGGSR